MGEGSCPAAVTQGMYLHRDLVLPFAQLQGARTAWPSKVPMMAAGAPGQFALASHDQTTPPALVEGLPGGELETEFEHGGWPPPAY